jgi:hypothetical protein
MFGRLVDSLVRLLLPGGETGNAIRADLEREANALAGRRPRWMVELGRIVQAFGIALYFLAHRLRGWFGDGAADIRYAVRRLGRAPLGTGVAIAVAGLGIGAATATFSVLEAVLLRPLPPRGP